MNRNILKELGVEGNILERKPRPGTAKEIISSSIEVTVDNKPQLLRPIKPFIDATSAAPSDLSNNAQLVLNGLLDCFRKNGFVKEGLAEDILFGFEATYPKELDRVAYGLVDLKRAGYIKFITPDGCEADEHCSNLGKCWVKYTQLLINLVYGG